jgi:hypothetical protein
MLSVILRAWAVFCWALTLPLVLAGFVDPGKPWIDLIARVFLWPTLGLLCWSTAEALDRCADRTKGGPHAPVH